MWKNEQMFTRFIKTKLALAGYDCYRIESHTTANGIPDMFIIGKGDSNFIEFKNMPAASVHDKSWKVQWRPGQQAFMLKYMLGHSQVYRDIKVFKCCWTLCGMKDGYIAILHKKIFENNIVDSNDVLVNPNMSIFKKYSWQWVVKEEHVDTAIDFFKNKWGVPELDAPSDVLDKDESIQDYIYNCMINQEGLK